MHKREFIRREVEQYIRDNVSASRSKIDVASDMPSFESFIIWVYQRDLYGEKFPVDVLDMYIYSEKYEQIYEDIIIETVMK